MRQDGRQDDATIVDRDRLLRWVRAIPSHLVHSSDGSRRPSSAVFKDPELSVNIESVMLAEKRVARDAIPDPTDTFLTSISPRIVREYDAEKSESHPIVRDPGPPQDTAHGLILGTKSNAFANAMVRSHVWVVAPE